MLIFLWRGGVFAVSVQPIELLGEMGCGAGRVGGGAGRWGRS